jgi:hypothetical protein
MVNINIFILLFVTDLINVSNKIENTSIVPIFKGYVDDFFKQITIRVIVGAKGKYYISLY